MCGATATMSTLPPEGLASCGPRALRRNVGIGGLTYRPLKKFSFSRGRRSGIERRRVLPHQPIRLSEGSRPGALSGDRALSFSADFNLLNNQDPQPGINYDYLAHQESLSSYGRRRRQDCSTFRGVIRAPTVRSDIDYLDPGTLQPQLSHYRDNSHTATALFHFSMACRTRAFAPELMAGGSLLISSGSRPTTYYQPMVKLSLPVGKHLTWFAEWRYYGYGEAFYFYEGFRAQLGHRRA